MTAPERGQIVTVEALLAAIVLVGSLVFALHVVAVTANTASTANAEIGADHRSAALGVLDRAVDDGSLKASLLYWNDSAGAFHDADDAHYISRNPPTRFGEALNRSFAQRQIRYNVDLYIHDASGSIQSQRVVHYGTPTDDAVRVTRIITLYDDDRLLDADEDPTNVTLAEAGNFYAVNASTETPLYHVVRVEVVLWQS